MSNSANERYDFFRYEHKRRFAGYWHQIGETLRLDPQSVLEVGKGSGLVSGYLRSKGISLVTMDIDSGLKPDVTGSCFRMPFKDLSFDVVACFQVLEHLPFEGFAQALEEMARIVRRNMVISLPDAGFMACFSAKLPGIRTLEFMLPLPWYRRRHRFDGEHYWEINKRGYPLNRVQRDIEKYFKIIKTFRSFENPYHRFFVLKKKLPGSD